MKRKNRRPITWPAVLVFWDALSSTLSRQLRHQASFDAILVAGLLLRLGRSRLLGGRALHRRFARRGIALWLFLLRPHRQFVGQRFQLEPGRSAFLGFDSDADRAALLQLAEQHLVGQR